MSSRKKLIVSLSVVALVVIAAVVAVVGVFAAGQQNIDSQVYITFTAVDIEGSVTVRYNTQDVNATALTDWTLGEVQYGIQNAGSASFLANETQANANTNHKTLTLGTSEKPIHLPGSNYVAMVEYKFTRASKDYSAGVTFSSDVFYAEVLTAPNVWTKVNAVEETDETSGEKTGVWSGSLQAFASMGEGTTEKVVIMRLYPITFANDIKTASAVAINWVLAAA